jgi:hypothetical protein
MRTAAETAPDDYQAQAKVDRFLAYWRSLPCPPHRAAPTVQTLLDHVQPDLQPYVALVDVVPPELLRVRLFGTAREASFGANITSTNALDVFEPHLRADVFERVSIVARHPAGWLTQRITTSSRGSTMRFLSLTLPLSIESGANPCVVNFGATMDVRPKDEMVPKVNAVMGCQWIDVGAGIPSISPAF